MAKIQTSYQRINVMKDCALLKPILIGPYQLPNRIFMAPLTRSRCPDNFATALTATYYHQRASAGLIISEGSQVSKQAVGYPNTPGIYSEKQVDAWKSVIQGVHEQKGHIFCQLWHCGRISLPQYHYGLPPLAPSAINPNQQLMNSQGQLEATVTPQEMTIDDIKNAVDEFCLAAKNAIDAGFDGVEIHSANGYLFHQFFSNCSNTRNDAYGGSHENKTRFFFEVLEAVGQTVGFEKIGIRLNPSLHGMFGISIDKDTIPTFEYLIERLNNYKALAYLHLTEPMTPVKDVRYAVAHIAARFRPCYQGTLVINCGFDLDRGNRVIEEGLADAVAFGKPFISNPDLVERIQENIEWASWDEATFYTLGTKGYTDYPNRNYAANSKADTN